MFNALKQMPDYISPGLDWLPAEFYTFLASYQKAFVKPIKDIPW